MTNTRSWDLIAEQYLAQRQSHSVRISYGRDLPDDAELRLVPNLADKRVIDLGCGGGNNAVVMAKAGAKVIAVDTSNRMLELAEAHAAASKAKVEFHHGDLAELAWLRAESIEFALCTGVLAEVEDIDRALRQVHRVLRPGSSFVFTHAHPTGLCCHNEYATEGGLPLGTLEVRRSYFDEKPIELHEFDQPFQVFPRTISTLFAALGRAGFSIETLLEPEPAVVTSLAPTVPAELVIRAKKLGN